MTGAQFDAYVRKTGDYFQLLIPQDVAKKLNIFFIISGNDNKVTARKHKRNSLLSEIE